MCRMQVCCPVQLEPGAPSGAPSEQDVRDSAAGTDFALCSALAWVSSPLPAAPTPVGECCSNLLLNSAAAEPLLT